jgi:hypothetical protein
MWCYIVRTTCYQKDFPAKLVISPSGLYQSVISNEFPTLKIAYELVIGLARLTSSNEDNHAWEERG